MLFLPCFDFPLRGGNTGSIFLVVIVKGESVYQTAGGIVRSLILDDIGDDSGFTVIVRVLRKEVLEVAMPYNNILVEILDFVVGVLVRHDLLMVFKELDEGLVAQVVSIESECIHTNFHKTGQKLLHFRKDML